MAGDNLPKYLQIKNEIMRWIVSGELQPGDKIPTEVVLAEQFNISRQTVRQAMGELVHEGLLYREQGRGTFLSNTSSRETSHQKPSYIIGVITTYISDYIFPSIIRGIEEVASKEGYSIILSSTQNRTELERNALQSAIRKHVDGLIVEPTLSSLPNPNIDSYFAVMNNDIPIVMLHASYSELDLPCVRIDDEKAGRELIEYLVSLGHSRIGGIFKSDDLQGKLRLTGFVGALKETFLQLPEEHISLYNADDVSDKIEDYAKRFVKSQPDSRPTGIVCYNDQVAIDLVNALTRENISIPKDVSIVSFDNSTLSETGLVKLTSMDHPKYEMGRAAGELIVSEINQNRSTRTEKPADIVLPSELIVRSSSKAINSTQQPVS